MVKEVSTLTDASLGEGGRGWDVEIVTVAAYSWAELVGDFEEVVKLAGRGGGMGERESWYLGARAIAESWVEDVCNGSYLADVLAVSGLSMKLCEEDMGRDGCPCFKFCFISLYVLADALVVCFCMEVTGNASCFASITASNSSIDVMTGSPPSVLFGPRVGGSVLVALSFCFFLLPLKNARGDDRVVSTGFLVGASLLLSLVDGCAGSVTPSCTTDGECLAFRLALRREKGDD